METENGHNQGQREEVLPREEKKESHSFSTGDFVESTEPDLRPGGPVLVKDDGTMWIGGWKVDELGYYSAPSGSQDRVVWERQKEASVARGMYKLDKVEKPENLPLSPVYLPMRVTGLHPKPNQPNQLLDRPMDLPTRKMPRGMRGPSGENTLVWYNSLYYLAGEGIGGHLEIKNPDYISLDGGTILSSEDRKRFIEEKNRQIQADEAKLTGQS
ncbi:MAG: hypothetical protein AAB360_01420 [Patescibacteria group bacterium]